MPVDVPRFGVMALAALRSWEAEAIAALERQGAECVLIEADAPRLRARSGFARAVDALVLSVAGLRSSMGRAGDSASELLRDRPVVLGEHACRDRGLSFILVCGAGPIPSWLTECAALGAWRFHQAEGIFGAAPFLYDLCLGRDVTSFGLARVWSAGSSQVLIGGRFRARMRSPADLYDEVTAQAAQWPRLVLKHFEINGTLPRSTMDYPDRPAHMGPFFAVFTLAARATARFLQQRLFVYLQLETWKVGILRMPIDDIVSGRPLNNIRWVPARKVGVSLADPFILSNGPTIQLLVEEFAHSERGKIVSVTLASDPAGAPDVGTEVCLQSKHHLSYPYLFRDKETLYCLPECHQSGRSTLYRVNGNQLTPVRDLLSDARITDASIVFDGTFYWLFCGIEDNRDQLNLFIFYASELDGDWKAHLLNPVKTDVTSSRPGGQIIFKDGQILRPAQDCSRSYGSGLVINRVDVLSVTEFRETTIAAIRPDAISRSCLGVHTLNFDNDLIAIDAKFRASGWTAIYVRCCDRVARVREYIFNLVRQRRVRAGPEWRQDAVSGDRSSVAACPSE